MSKLKVFILLMILFAKSSIAAPMCGVGGNKNSSVTVLFVNGIMNNQDGSCKGSEALYDSLIKNGLNNQNYFQTYVYNPTDGGWGDVNELRMQAAISSQVTKLNVAGSLNGYYQQLGGIYKTLLTNYATDGASVCSQYLFPAPQVTAPNGKNIDFGLARCKGVLDFTEKLSQYIDKYAKKGGVVVVPHSQGNFYTEAAYALLVFNNNQYLDKIKVVGVAAIAANPVGGKYITINQDNALFSLQLANASVITGNLYSPKQSNATACLSYSKCTSTEGMDYETLRQATGSSGLADSSVVSYFLLGNFPRLFDSQRALFHEFKEVYLNERIINSDTGKTLPSIIAGMVQDSINELNQTPPPSSSTITATITGGSDGGSYSFTNFQTKKMYSFNGGTTYMPQLVATDASGNKLEVTYCAVDTSTVTNFCDINTYGYWYVAFTKATGNKYAAPGGGFQTTGSHRSGESIGTFTADIGLTTNGATRLAVTGNLNVTGIPITQCGTTPLTNCFPAAGEI